MKQLQISKTLSLPVDAVTQTFGILAIRGAGKTYTAKVLAEELQKSGSQVVCLDPTGVLWGLTSSADGKSAGLSMIVIGGEHGNVTLESAAGKIIARFVVESKHSVIIDVSDFSGGELIRFMTDFATELFHLKARDRYPLHLMIDEADTFAPQRPFPKEAQMLGAMEKLVKQGRSRGIGCTLITQRPATLNKNVLTQIETLIVLRMTAPRDRKAIDEWVEAHGTPEERKIMMESLASLPNGTAWFWSPSWAKKFEKIVVRKLETFDSSATPDSATQYESIQRASVDIAALSEEIKSVIEKAKANDPAELKKQVAALKAENAKLLSVKPAKNLATPQASNDRAYKAAIDKREKEIGVALKIIYRQKDKFVTMASDLVKEFNKIIDAIAPLGIISKIELQEYVQNNAPSDYSVQKSSNTADPSLSKCAKKLLQVIAQCSPVTRGKLSIMSEYSKNSSTFGNGLTELRKINAISGSDPISITDDGLAAVGDFEPLPTGEQARAYWSNSLPPCPKAIFAVLLHHHGHNLSREDLGVESGYSVTSSTFGNGLTYLRKLGLIEGSKDLKAVDTLFED